MIAFKKSFVIYFRLRKRTVSPLNYFFSMEVKDQIHSAVGTGNTGRFSDSKVVVPSEMATDQCVQVLQRGGVIAVPTDTIYGIAASAINTEAIEKIYSIKGRDQMKPVAICVGKPTDVDKWAYNTVSTELLNQLLPGPVTLVLRRRESLNPCLNPDSSTVGIRIPSNSFIVKLAQRFDGPIALTSANVSNEKSTLRVEEFQSLWPKLDLVVDGGMIGHGDEKEGVASRSGSTVVDLSKPGFYSIIRQGCASIKTIEQLEEFGLTRST